jgi:prephenate dehydrogenase
VTSVLGVIGTGLIGASIGLRARAAGTYVMGCDARDEAAAEAAANGAIDRAVSWEELVEASDTIVVAAYLSGTLETIERLRLEPPRKAALILDVASVKAPVVAAADGLAPFVATHPMAGSERSGPSAARADLFEAATWAYVPSGEGARDERARRFIGMMGANAYAVDADEHDRIVALTSHLPQLIAWCYARVVTRDDPRAGVLCGPVARELLRLGGMSDAMWRDVLHANAVRIEPALRDFVRQIAGLHRSSVEGKLCANLPATFGVDTVSG